VQLRPRSARYLAELGLSLLDHRWRRRSTGHAHLACAGTSAPRPSWSGPSAASAHKYSPRCRPTPWPRCDGSCSASAEGADCRGNDPNCSEDTVGPDDADLIARPPRPARGRGVEKVVERAFKGLVLRASGAVAGQHRPGQPSVPLLRLVDEVVERSEGAADLIIHSHDSHDRH